MKDEFQILINEIRENKTNGDIEIARMTLYFLLDHFSSLINDDIREVGTELEKSKVEMASIQNIARLLTELYASPKLLHAKLTEFKEKTKINYTDNVIHNFMETLSAPVKIITISRSSTVKRALILLSKNDLLKDLFIIHSYPGLEGLTLAKELSETGIHSIPICLAEIIRYVPLADFAVSGADAITGDYIINKLGTRLLFEYAKINGKRTTVLGNPLKRIVRDIKINNKIFEKIPTKYIDNIYI